MSTDRKDVPSLKKVRLSCYIRTRNEERLIASVIERALTVADELVIVDSGSTDRTLEIARSFGARVVEQTWLGWGRQKRVGEDACTNDWLLDLDADEVLTPELSNEISELFANGEPSTPVWFVRMVTAPPVGEPWYKFRVDNRKKLYNRRYIRMPDDRAWDQLAVPSGVQVGQLREPLLHY